MQGFLLSVPGPLGSSAIKRAKEFGGLSWKTPLGKDRRLSGGKDLSVGLPSVVLRRLKNGALFRQRIKKED